MKLTLPVSRATSAKDGLPRWFECASALLALVALSPLLLLIGILVRLTSPGAALFRQERIGLAGKPFELLKFRTMRSRSQDADGNSGEAEVTRSGDPRITWIGRWLRATKLDELPELFNILRGDMSVVGPRPEVPRFVNLADPRWQTLLLVRPGLTDSVTLLLRDEEALLTLGAQRTGLQTEGFYRQHLLPFKLELGIASLETRSVSSDIGTAFRTAAAILRPRGNVDSLLDRVLDQHRESSEL